VGYKYNNAVGDDTSDTVSLFFYLLFLPPKSANMHLKIKLHYWGRTARWSDGRSPGYSALWMLWLTAFRNWSTDRLPAAYSMLSWRRRRCVCAAAHRHRFFSSNLAAYFSSDYVCLEATQTTQPSSIL